LNKKVQKGLVAAVAATMGASVVAPTAFAASQTQNVSLDAQYAEAYTATAKALESKSQKDLTAARVLVDNLYNTVKGTANEFLATTLSSILDPAQQVKLVAFFDAMNKAEVSGKQADINAAQTLIIDMPQVWRNSYSTAMDTIQQKLIDKVVEATKKAQASASETDKAAAQALLDEIKTVTNNEGVANWAKAYQSTIDAVVTVARVESVSAVNQKMIQVKFNKDVDYGTATNIANYKINGTSLNSSYYLRMDDARTITLYAKSGAYFDQDAKLAVEISGILEDLTFNKVVEYDGEITVKDTANPTLVSAKLSNGNKTLDLVFNEALANGSVSSADFKLNGNDLSTYGVTNVYYRSNADDATQIYTNRVRITFAEALPDGNYDVTVKNGQLYDPANFYAIDQKQSFVAKADNGAMNIVSTTAVVGQQGKISIKFNKTVSATMASGFELNGSTPTSVARHAVNTDTIVITGDVKDGANLIVIPADQRDSFGNKFAENDLRISVNGVKDTTKPTVEKVYALSDKKVRVKFSEDVNVEPFASNKANYTIKEADGTVVYSSTVDSTKYNVTTAVDDDGALVDLAFDTALPGSSYTLEIKGLRDGSGNEMTETKLNFTSPDKTAPTLKADGNNAVKVGTDTVEVFFSEAMDSSTLLNKSNFLYYDGTEYKTLPSTAKVSVGAGSKSVKITFPSTVNRDGITKVKVLSVKDAAGNLIAGGSEESTSPGTNTGANNKVVAGSASIAADSDKITLSFTTKSTITTVSKADFNGILGLSETADSVVVVGNTVKVIYNKTNTSFAAIKAAGDNLVLGTKTLSSTTNAYGDVLELDLTGDDAAVADKIAPEFISVTEAGANQVLVTFNENISNENLGELKDDYIVVVNGSQTTVKSAAVSGSTLTLTVADSLANVIVTLDSTKVSVKDASGNKYVPTKTDKEDKTFQTAGEVNQAAVNAEKLKYETAVTIANSVTATTDITSMLEVLKSGKTADGSIAVSAAIKTDAASYLTETAGVIKLAKTAANGATDNKAVVTLTFSKGGKTTTLDVNVTIATQP